MSDESIADRIESLVDQEQELRRREQADSAKEDSLADDREQLRPSRSSWTDAGTYSAAAGHAETPAPIHTRRSPATRAP